MSTVLRSNYGEQRLQEYKMQYADLKVCLSVPVVLVAVWADGSAADLHPTSPHDAPVQQTYR